MTPQGSLFISGAKFESTTELAREEVRSASGALQGNFLMKAMLSIMKFRGRGTWPSPFID